MHIKRVHIGSSKTFSDLTISDLPDTARLVVMVGPNGCGKSSVFDAFRLCHGVTYGAQWRNDVLYYQKDGLPEVSWGNRVQIDFHESVPADTQQRRKLFYIRSAYRNEADFTSTELRRVSSVFDAPMPQRLIDNDQTVADNYRRLAASALEHVYSGDYDTLSVKELRERLIGEVRDSMRRVFDGLMLKGTGRPLEGGSFFFEKGVSTNFHYKNLSGGEKAAFDIMLDLILKRETYDNSVYCIDEPEAHMHTQLQARLLEELMRLIPGNSQLWIATHSIGMIRKAKDLQQRNPGEVAFLDFYDKDFDQEVTLIPAQLDRDFWSRALTIALDDLATLVAPKRIVLCEGRPSGPHDTVKAALDSRCYQTIFANEYADTDFISVGNDLEVQSDRLHIGRAIQALISGTTVIRLIDRDDRSQQEVTDLREAGVRVLTRRHLEAYLLDDEILQSLCSRADQPEKSGEVLAAKKRSIAESVKRGNPPDDVKSAAGPVCVKIKRILGLTQAGKTTEAFLRDTMAPLVVPGTKAYSELQQDIFGK